MTRNARYLRAALVALAMSCAVTVGAEEQPEITTVGGIADTVAIENLVVRDGVVNGTLANRTGRALRDVKILVRYAWLWKNERAPQRDNPGRSYYTIVAGEVPSHGTLTFVYRPEPPLPQRTDGRFDPSVEVVGFTEVGD